MDGGRAGRLLRLEDRGVGGEAEADDPETVRR